MQSAKRKAQNNSSKLKITGDLKFRFGIVFNFALLLCILRFAFCVFAQVAGSRRLQPAFFSLRSLFVRRLKPAATMCLCAFVPVCLSVVNAANGVRAEAYVDKSRVTVGERITYNIAVDMPKDMEVRFPTIQETLGGFEVKDSSEEGPVKSDQDRLRYKHWYVLESYTVGSYVIPPLTVKVTAPSGKETELSTSQIFVEVVSVLPKGEIARDIRDIKPPLSLGPSYLLVGSIILACLAGILGFFVYRRRVKRQIAVPSPPPKPAHVVALEELQRILGLGLVESGKIKEYYFLLSGCLRHYIEDRFGLGAPELTTEEFLEATLKTEAMPWEHRKLVKAFLEQADMVKFARFHPEKEEIGKAYALAEEFINLTKETDSITFSQRGGT